MYVVGLTGGIGSGKSAAAAMFAELGASVVDTDAIAHMLTRPHGAAIGPIRAAFGEQVIAPDGALDRAAMRRLAFSEPQAKRRLEQILHPMIRDDCERQIRGAEGPYVILVVPLLVESGAYRERVDRVVVVDCPEQLQVERVGARSGLPADEVRAIMEAQASRSERLAVADDVINNGGSLSDLRPQVERLHASYLRRSRADAGV